MIDELEPALAAALDTIREKKFLSSRPTAAYFRAVLQHVQSETVYRYLA